MKLTAADEERFKKWIEEKCGAMRCTCCGHARWTIVDIATLPIGFDLRSTRFHYHNGVPQLTLACSNCGNMLFFNTNIMGIKPDPPPPVPVKEGGA